MIGRGFDQREAQVGSLAFLCGEQEGDNRTEAVRKSTSELGYNVASMAWKCRFLAARPSQDGRVIAEK